MQNVALGHEIEEMEAETSLSTETGDDHAVPLKVTAESPPTAAQN